MGRSLHLHGTSIRLSRSPSNSSFRRKKRIQSSSPSPFKLPDRHKKTMILFKSGFFNALFGFCDKDIFHVSSTTTALYAIYLVCTEHAQSTERAETGRHLGQLLRQLNLDKPHKEENELRQYAFSNYAQNRHKN